MAHGYRAAFLPPSHTSLHFCKSLGDVRSFFQLLQVSIKLAADSSVEQGAVVRRKPEATAVPPPHGFSWGRGEARQRAGAPSTVPGALSSRRPSGWATGSHLHPMNTMNMSSVPRFGSCSYFTGSHQSLRRVGRSEDGETFSLRQEGAVLPETTGALRYNCQAPSQSLCPGRTPPQGGCQQSGHAGSVQHGA